MTVLGTLENIVTADESILYNVPIDSAIKNVQYIKPQSNLGCSFDDNHSTNIYSNIRIRIWMGE